MHEVGAIGQIQKQVVHTPIHGDIVPDRAPLATQPDDFHIQQAVEYFSCLGEHRFGGDRVIYEFGGLQLGELFFGA